MKGSLAGRILRRTTLGLGIGVGLLFFLAVGALHLLAARFEGDDPLPEGRIERLPWGEGQELKLVRQGPVDADRAVILVHGTPGTFSAFDDMMASDWQDYEVITYDRPGFGRSSGGREVASVAAQAEALEAIIDALPAKEIVLVGHSYGAPIVLAAAVGRPERVSAVVSMGGSVGAQFEKPVWIQHLGRPGIIGAVLPRAADHSNMELLRLKAELEELEKRLPEIKAPVLVLHGEKDGLVPVGNATWLAGQWEKQGRAERLRLVIRPDLNHFIPWTEPEFAVREILDFAADPVTASGSARSSGE